MTFKLGKILFLIITISFCINCKPDNKLFEEEIKLRKERFSTLSKETTGQVKTISPYKAFRKINGEVKKFQAGHFVRFEYNVKGTIYEATDILYFKDVGNIMGEDVPLSEISKLYKLAIMYDPENPSTGMISIERSFLKSKNFRLKNQNK